ncbi:MAG: hypothetical protein AB1540_06590, partial [Bdellovibrionota bacterium]
TRAWSDETSAPMAKILKGHRFDLSSKETFKYLQRQADGTSKPHQGEAPNEIRPYDIEVRLEREKNIGWPEHERISLSLSVYKRGNRLIAGPFKASVVRKISKTHASPEDFPGLYVPLHLGGNPVILNARCGGDLSP